MGLSISYTELLEQIGRKMGFSSDRTTWTTELTDAQRFIRSGLRRFYFPMLEGGRHVWSFLTPVATLTVASGEDTYELPDNFVDIRSGFVFTAGGGTSVRLAKKSEADVRELAQKSPKSGMPEFYAIRSKGLGDGHEQRYEVQFYPTPDAAYSLNYRYQLSPPDLSETAPYPLGGPQHSETILASVLACAEELLDDEPQVYSAQFQRLLAASVALDRGLADEETEDGDDIWDASSGARTLSIDVGYLRRVVGRELEFGPNPKLWTRKQAEEVQLAIESGYRQFCYPPQVVEDRAKHVWSFLTPTARLVVTSGSDSVVLPPDFSELASETVTFVGANIRAAVRVGSDSIRRLQSTSPAVGNPAYVAVQVVNTEGMGGTQYELMLYPTPDSDVTLEYRYLLTPAGLSDESPIPLGGSTHAETIIAACLSAAEKMKGIRDGQREVQFRQLLANSIIRDVELSSPSEGEIWPLEDAQTLSVNKAYLKRMVGRLSGFGAHSSLWTHSQLKQIEATLEAGLRKFYNPMVLPGQRYSHEWSFLCPLATLTTVEGVYDYDLPNDFAMFQGPLTYEPGESNLFPPINIFGEEQLRARRQFSAESASRPAMGAVVPKRPDGEGRTLYTLTVWPTPSGEFTLHYRYRISPESMPDETTLPIGGPVHAQTILEACLCAAEEMAGVRNGLHAERFLECLRASVSHDLKVSAPETYGYNGDRSDDRYGLDNWHEYNDNLVTYKGQTW